MVPLPLQTATRIGLNVLLLLAGVVALRLGESIFVPMIIALLLAAVLGPAAMWLHTAVKIRWTLACLIVIFGLVLLNIVLTLFFAAAASRLAQQVPPPNDSEKVKAVYLNLREKLEAFSPWELDEVLFPPKPKDVGDIRVYQYLTEAAPRVMQEIARYMGNGIFQSVLIFFILLFMLLEGRMLTRRVVEIFGPSAEVQARVADVLRDMAHQVRTYIVWRTIINFGLAVAVGVVYQTAGLRQAWTWAVLLAILNYIPYLGPLVAGIPPFIDALLSNSPGAALVIMVFYWVIIILEGYLIVPVLMGRSMDMNATTVMLACLFWDLVWGVPGLFLAMPIMAGIKAVLHHVPEWRAWANLMAAEDEEPKPLVIPPPEPANGKPGAAASDLPAVRQ